MDAAAVFQGVIAGDRIVHGSGEGILDGDSPSGVVLGGVLPEKIARHDAIPVIDVYPAARHVSRVVRDDIGSDEDRAGGDAHDAAARAGPIAGDDIVPNDGACPVLTGDPAAPASRDVVVGGIAFYGVGFDHGIGHVAAINSAPESQDGPSSDMVSGDSIMDDARARCVAEDPAAGENGKSSSGVDQVPRPLSEGESVQ